MIKNINYIEDNFNTDRCIGGDIMNSQNSYEKNIQNSLMDFFRNNKYCTQVLGFASIFIYIYVAVNIIEMIPMPTIVMTIFNYFSAILYFGCMASLIMSYAQNEMMPIFIYFAYHTLSPVISLFKWGISVNRIVYIVIYGALTFWAFKKCFNGTATIVITNETKTSFCPHCGKAMNSNSSFCGNCGNKI